MTSPHIHYPSFQQQQNKKSQKTLKRANPPHTFSRDILPATPDKHINCKEHQKPYEIVQILPLLMINERNYKSVLGLPYHNTIYYNFVYPVTCFFSKRKFPVLYILSELKMKGCVETRIIFSDKFLGFS